MFTAVLFSLLAVQGTVQPNEAEKLYRAFEAKVVAAKAVKVVAEGDLRKGDSVDATVKTDVLFAQGNKLKARVALSSKGKEVTFDIASDGKRLRLSAGFDKAAVRDVSNNLHDLMVMGVSSGGTTVLFTLLHEDIKVGEIPLSRFRMGPDEKVGGRDAKVIHYLAGAQEIGTTYTLWLDAKTLLPLKRRGVQEAAKAQGTEVYREFVLDPKVDASAFELPN